MLVQVPQEMSELCAIALWLPVQGTGGMWKQAQLPAHLLCAEAPGLVVRGLGEEWKPAPSSCSSFFSAFFPVTASSKHNQIGNLHPTFLLHLAPVLLPQGLK